MIFKECLEQDSNSFQTEEESPEHKQSDFIDEMLQPCQSLNLANKYGSSYFPVQYMNIIIQECSHNWVFHSGSDTTKCYLCKEHNKMRGYPGIKQRATCSKCFKLVCCLCSKEYLGFEIPFPKEGKIGGSYNTDTILQNRVATLENRMNILDTIDLQSEVDHLKEQVSELKTLVYTLLDQQEGVQKQPQKPLVIRDLDETSTSHQKLEIPEYPVHIPVMCNPEGLTDIRLYCRITIKNMVIDTLAFVDTRALISTVDSNIIPQELLSTAAEPLITRQMDGTPLENTQQVKQVKLQFATTCQGWSKPYHIDSIWVKDGRWWSFSNLLSLSLRRLSRSSSPV